jgi:hypothetical protein
VKPTKTPTPSPTPPCEPTATSTAIGLGDQLPLNAQGVFSRPSKPGQVAYRDVTNSLNTAFRTNNCTAVVYSGNGIFTATQTGCCCIDAETDSVFSQEFSVNVNGAPECAACPQPPTPTPSVKADGAAASSADDSAQETPVDSQETPEDSEATPEASP